MISLYGLKIVVDPYMPGPMQIRFPSKGPYFKRRQKKMAMNPKNFKFPEHVYRVGDTVFLHPWQYEQLKQQVASQ